MRRLTVLCCRVLSAEEAAAGVDLMREVAEAELEFLGLIIFRNEPKVIYGVFLRAILYTRASSFLLKLLAPWP